MAKGSSGIPTDNLRAAVGIVALLSCAWVVSESRRSVPWRTVGLGLGLTILSILLLLKVPPIRTAFALVNNAVDAVASATRAGTSFVFGYLGGGPLPFELKTPGSEFILAFQALPMALVMSVLTTLLFHWRILPPVIRGFSWLLERTLGVGGAVGLSTAANIFVGMVEAPLFIRPYLDRLSRSELFIVMTGGMAGIAGTVFVVYVTLLRPIMPDVAVHLLTASVAGAPAAIMISQIIVPEKGEIPAADQVQDPEPVAASTMDAIVKGTTVGLELLLNVTAMLIVFIALVHLANAALGLLPEVAGPITLQRQLGYIMAPLCWLMGVPWAEAVTAGALMGVKTILNEFIAYVQMASLPAEALSPRSRLIMLYALCGFANFGSLGIMIGGLTAIAPSRREEIVALGPRSLIAGTLATCLLGAIVGALS
jgi:CNT family concentrative nucleoside transporter